MSADDLLGVLRAYATLQQPKSIRRPEISYELLHDCLLNHLLLNPHFTEFPPSKQYQISFWKWAIDWLESLLSEEDELDERFYTHHIELMHDTASKNVGSARPAESYVTYLWPTGRNIDRPVYPGHESGTLLESRTTIEAGTTGLRTWSASLILGQYLLSNPELVAHRRVLELGCGSGFLGIVVASLQVADGDRPSAISSLWLTDVNEPVLQRCQVNLTLPCNSSHLHPNLTVHLLDWSDAQDSANKRSAQAFFWRASPDVIIGADLVYDPSIIPLLVNVLVLALIPEHGNPNMCAYIALTVRNEATLADFVRQAGKVLDVELVYTTLVSDNIFTATTELGQDTSQAVKIFKIRRLSGY